MRVDSLGGGGGGELHGPCDVDRDCDLERDWNLDRDYDRERDADLDRDSKLERDWNLAGGGGLRLFDDLEYSRPAGFEPSDLPDRTQCTNR